MKCYVTVRSGVCEQVVCSDNTDLLFDPNIEIFEVDRLYDANDLYFRNNQVLVKPTPPSTLYSWDDSSHAWVLDNSKALDSVKNQRNLLLQRSDWTQLADIPQETKALWEPYRQALRDITDQPDPFNIVWPTPPTA